MSISAIQKNISKMEIDENTPKPFPLLRLPAIPLYKIILDKDFSPFEFALLSRRSRRIVKTSKCKAENFIIQHIGGQHGFKVKVRNSNICWWFEDALKNKHYSYKFTLNYIIGGLDFPTRHDRKLREHEYISAYDSSKLLPIDKQFTEQIRITPNRRLKGKPYYTRTLVPVSSVFNMNTCPDYETSILVFIDFMKDVFNTDVTGFHVDYGSVPDFETFFIENVMQRNVKTFELSGTKLRRFRYVMDVDCLHFVLLNTPIDVELRLSNGVFEEPFEYNEPIRQKSIEIYCETKWFKGNNFLQAQSNKIVLATGRYSDNTFGLNGANIPETDILKFIRRWLNGSDREFQYFDVQSNCHGIRFDGIPFHEHNSKRKTSDFEWNPLTFERNWYREDRIKDLRRSDGMEATLRIYSSNVVFCVWHRKKKSFWR
uniref:F-box domain-containing protein n=1 Tax=Caenorhabditis tropicalis TaxID=1561998 RepID=A0A1I7UWD5_9PELO